MRANVVAVSFGLIYFNGFSSRRTYFPHSPIHLVPFSDAHCLRRAADLARAPREAASSVDGYHRVAKLSCKGRSSTATAHNPRGGATTTPFRVQGSAATGACDRCLDKLRVLPTLSLRSRLTTKKTASPAATEANTVPSLCADDVCVSLEFLVIGFSSERELTFHAPPLSPDGL